METLVSKKTQQHFIVFTHLAPYKLPPVED